MAAGRWSGSSRHRSAMRRASDREPLNVGWGVRDLATRGETAVGVFERDRLSDGLARLHAQGFGPAARVLDGARGDLSGQLARAGLPTELVERLVKPDRLRTTALLVVHAPARGQQVAELLGRSGALAVEVIAPEPPPVPLLPIDAGAALIESGG